MKSIIIIISIILTIVLLLIVGTTTTPFRILKRIGINLVIGLFFLLTINYVGNRYGFNVPVNEFSTVLVGVLGVPGFLVLLVLKTLI
jgi:inhibitor of the pro-sigma K processing machinery